MHKIDFSFDPDADSWYIQLNERHIYRVKKISNHLVLDIDEDGMIVGINYLTIGANIPFDVLKKDYGLTSEEEVGIKRYFQM